MAKTSAIEWTDATWNPFMGCKKVSTGCARCYMFRDQKRFGHDPTILRKSKTTFRDPIKWREPRMVFVCSWSDFFWEEVPNEWRREAWAVMAMSSRHTFLLLTKRPENIPAMLPESWHREPWPNVWLGTSAENQETANLRIMKLLDNPAQVHFLSAEPLLGPIQLWKSWLPGTHFENDGTPWPTLDWVITGGESDLKDPRPMELDWARSVRDQCVEASVAYFHKQSGGSRKCKCHDTWGCRLLDGRIWEEFPDGR